MKTTKLVGTLIALTGAMSMHYNALATEPNASGSGAVSLSNNVKGNFSVGSNGSATSYAYNSEAATAKVTATALNKPNFSNVSAGVSGATTTDSYGKAYNVSTGSGSGYAASSGHVAASTNGQFGIHGVTNGFNGGSAGTESGNLIKAGTNQGSYVAGQTMAGFDAKLDYAKSTSYVPAPAGLVGGTKSATVTLSDTKSGYASGANSKGALDGMNAAGLANIGASGQFFAKVKASAATGTVSAP